MKQFSPNMRLAMGVELHWLRSSIGETLYKSWHANLFKRLSAGLQVAFILT